MNAVEQFAADYFIAEGITPKRRGDVLLALRELENHACEAPEVLDDLALRAWVTDMVAGGLHVNTVRKKLHAVKPFYKWCWQQRIIDADRFMRIKDVKPPRGSTGHSRPRPYRRNEVARFWDQLDARYPLVGAHMIARYQRGTSRYKRIWTHATHLQVQAIASLALFGGLRRDEIRLIEIDDMHPDNQFIVVYGKSPFGERQGHREVPYTEVGREMVGEWLRFRTEVLQPEHDGPWLTLWPGASLNRGVFASDPLWRASEDSFKRLIPSVGRWELHRFRHTCATEWLRAGVELEQVSRLLGHASIQQTLSYAEIVRDDVARGMNRAESDFVAAVGRRNNAMRRAA